MPQDLPQQGERYAGWDGSACTACLPEKSFAGRVRSEGLSIRAARVMLPEVLPEEGTGSQVMVVSPNINDFWSDLRQEIDLLCTIMNYR